MLQGTISRNMQRSVGAAVTNSSDPFDSVPNTLAQARPHGSLHPAASPSVGRSLDNSARLPSYNGDISGAKAKPILQTCVVEPDNPHIFNLRPHSKAGKRGGQPQCDSPRLTVHLPASVKHHLSPSPSGCNIGAYAQARGLQSSGSVLSLDKSSMLDVPACDSLNASSPPPKVIGGYSKDAPSSADYHPSRQVLHPVDPNQHYLASPKTSEDKSIYSLRQLHKTIEPRAHPSASASSRASSQNRLRSESVSSQATRSSNHQYRSTSSYSSNTAPNSISSIRSTLAPAAQLSSDMPSLRRPHTLRSAPFAATSKREHAKNEAKLKRRHAVYHTLPFNIDSNNKLVSLSKGDQDASDSENGKSTASICGSPHSSRTHELDKKKSNPSFDCQEAVVTTSLSQDSTPRKSILKNSSESTPKASLSSKSLRQESIPRSKSSQFRLLPPRPLLLGKNPDRRRTVYRARKPDSPHPFRDLLLDIDMHIREWERL